MAAPCLVAGIGGPISGLLQTLLLLYVLAIVAVSLMSWIPHPTGGARTVFEALRRVTDPLLVPLRRAIPPIGGVFDITPMLLIFVLLILRGIV